MDDPFHYHLGEDSIQDLTSSDASNYCKELYQDGRKYHCCSYPDCGKIFRFKSEFNRHKVIHETQRFFNCPYSGCTKTFKREDALKNHVRIHTGELPFACEVEGCGQRFPTKAGLRYHSLKHKGDKPYQCTFPGCDKAFITLAQLKQHENASDYHKKVLRPANQPTDQVTVVEVAEKPEMNFSFFKEEKVDTMKKDMYLDEFFAPEPREVGNIQWEMKNQFEEPEEVDDELQDQYERMVKVILKENSAMKQRLDMCQTLMGLMHENADLKQKLSKTSEVDLFKEFKESEDQIFSFLDF